MSKHAHPLSDDITRTTEGMRIWQQERVIFEVTERICELLEQQKISRSELAVRLGKKSRGYVTQILCGSANLTLRTLSDIYLALGRQFIPHDGPITIVNDDCPVILSYVSADEDWGGQPNGDWDEEAPDAPRWKVRVS